MIMITEGLTLNDVINIKRQRQKTKVHIFDIDASLLQVMAAIIMKTHCEDKTSVIYDSIKSLPQKMKIASGCTGTGACLDCKQNI